MLKFFRRSKSKNTPPNNDSAGQNSKKSSKNERKINSTGKLISEEGAIEKELFPQTSDSLEIKNKSACVPSINVVLNKTHENQTKYKNDHIDQNTHKLTPQTTQRKHVAAVECGADCDRNTDEQQHHQQQQFPPCPNSCNTTYIYNSKECQKDKSLTSRNEIVDRRQCRSENVPSKRSTNNDRSTTTGQLLHDQQQQNSKTILEKNNIKNNNKSNRQKNIFFDPINKSREFFYDIIMAKGRNRNRNRNSSSAANNQNTNNKNINKYNKEQQQQQQHPQDHQNNTERIIDGHQEDKIELKGKEMNHNKCENVSVLINNNVIESGVENLNDNSKFFHGENVNSRIGYQITKSKNSTNLVMKYEQDDNDGDDRVQNEYENQLESTDNTTTDENDRGNLAECADANIVDLCENSHLNSSTQFYYNQQLQDDNDIEDDNDDDENEDEDEDEEEADDDDDDDSPRTIHQQREESSSDEDQAIVVEENHDDNVVEVESNDEIDETILVEDSTTSTTTCLNESTKTKNENAYHEDVKEYHKEGGQHPQKLEDDQFADQFVRDEIVKISELTECDRDRYIKIEMGQPNSKSNTEGISVSDNKKHENYTNSGFDSDGTYNSEHLHKSMPKNDRADISDVGDKRSDDCNIVIPTITVADFSDNTNENENDIFYDSTQTPLSFNSDHYFKQQTLSPTIPPPPSPPKSIPSTITSSVNIIDLGNDDDDEWHFVSNNDSDRVTIEDDNDPFNDHITYSSLNHTNHNKNNSSSNISNNSEIIDDSVSYSISTTTTTTTEKQIDSPDSGIGRSVSSSRILLIDSSQLLDNNTEDGDHLQGQQQIHQPIFLQTNDSERFMRGSSTDCDENLLQSDYETYFDNRDETTIKIDSIHQQKNQQHILIDSISLPDVVVESTGMGTSQSIPIKVENVITIEDHQTSTTTSSTILTDHNDNETRNLVNQEARFSAQLEDAQKIAFAAQSKVNDLQAKIDDLEKELSVKSWNVDRLQAELKAAQKEDECVRRKLKIIEEEKENLKQKYSETEDELNRRYEELQTKYQNLQDKYDQMKILTNSLKQQLAFAQSDAKQCRLDKEKLKEEKDEELRSLKEALEKSQEEQKALEQKWQKEFETLRTQNADREEHLLSDCEWQLREMQKTSKEKIEKAEKERKETLERAEEIETKAKNEMEEVLHLKSYEAEVRQLRGLTADQRQSLSSMAEQIEDLRSDLENANEKLEEQIVAVRKIRTQCENALSDKDRQMIQRIDEVRGEISEQWETKLLTEMTRLKSELEIVSVEERQDALHRLQVEHVEEIKALTTRYNANEQELREEIKSLREQLTMKDTEFKEFKIKSESEILETRLHLERADREYQYAMNRQEEKKEILMESLREEFDKEKAEMEEKFRERLGHVKDEFNRELGTATEELAVAHRKQLEQQWEQLIAEKEEALQAMESRHRIRLEEAENRIKDLEIEHQRDLKGLKTNFEIERKTLESRDLQNSQEIEQLHRKCRCLTNLFEEMRMRYERRDPRPEDLREISELRSRCEEQERDLQLLTERLREMQIEIQEQQQHQRNPTNSRKVKTVRKPPPKVIPISCDVIYEENEENESSPPPPQTSLNGSQSQENEEQVNGTTTDVYENPSAVAES